MTRFATTRRAWLGAFVFTLALLVLAFLAQASLHAHENGQDDPACGLCQVAHVGVAFTVSVELLSVVLLFFGEIAVFHCPKFSGCFFTLSPSRAPPALLG